MEWLTCIKSSIDYIEEHLLEIKSVEEVASNAYVSSFYLQQGFQILTGYSIGEYIRNRKLYLAAKELTRKGTKVVDIAFKYGYETHESFTKAFTRFHGFSPSKVNVKGNSIKRFEPLTINVSIRGGNVVDLNYKITTMFPFKVIGFVREFDFENSYKEIPLFWDEICEKYCKNIYAGNKPANDYEQAIMDNCIGEFGVCIDCKGSKFKYMIAGKYTGGKVPEGMMLFEFPMQKWAIFDCVGPCPETLQALNTKIFKEWLPFNKDFEPASNYNIEWYDCVNGEKWDPDYHTQIWIPVKNTNK